jgi:PAS domain S-box-containing protein
MTDDPQLKTGLEPVPSCTPLGPSCISGGGAALAPGDVDDVLRALSAHAIVSIADTHGTIRYANDKFCEISGYTREALIGRNHSMLKSGEHSAECYAAMWQTLCQGQIWRGEFCNRRKDGSLYWVESTIMPVIGPDGLPCSYVSVRTDITRVRKAEMCLRRSEADLSYAQDLAGLGTWTHDLETGVFQGSALAARIFGLPEGEPLSVDRILACAPLRDRARLRQVLSPDLTPEAPLEVVHQLVLESEVRYVRERASVLAGADELPVRVMGTVQDITAAKLSEQTMTDARLQAERASQAKSYFLTSMGHDLRTPLNAILGFGQVLAQDPSIGEDQRDSATEIIKAGKHLLALVDDVLDLSKIEAGKVLLSLKDMGMDEVVAECLSLVTPLAGAKGLSLVLDNKVPGARVRADRTRLKQVLINLLSNAIKYNRDTGLVRLIIEARGSLAQIIVEDTGLGISEDRLPYAFEPFNRLGAENGEIEGTGIGLTITRQLVNAMGGQVSVESVKGVGSRFSVELPLVSAADSLAQAGSGAFVDYLTSNPLSLQP